LRDKENQLVDIKLEALNNAHHLDQIKEENSKMRFEIDGLKQENQRMQELLIRASNANVAGTAIAGNLISPSLPPPPPQSQLSNGSSLNPKNSLSLSSDSASLSVSSDSNSKTNLSTSNSTHHVFELCAAASGSTATTNNLIISSYPSPLIKNTAINNKSSEYTDGKRVIVSVYYGEHEPFNEIEEVKKKERAVLEC
jgi:hypothetical protein